MEEVIQAAIFITAYLSCCVFTYQTMRRTLSLYAEQRLTAENKLFLIVFSSMGPLSFFAGVLTYHFTRRFIETGAGITRGDMIFLAVFSAAGPIGLSIIMGTCTGVFLAKTYLEWKRN